jgi:hypothetical protein
MARCGNNEKMGPGGLGESLQAKKKRRLGDARSTNDQQCICGETMVALGQRNYNTLGKPMEGKVCTGHSQSGHNPLWRNQGRLNHLEPSMAQQSMDLDTQLLGN